MRPGASIGAVGWGPEGEAAGKVARSVLTGDRGLLLRAKLMSEGRKKPRPHFDLLQPGQRKEWAKGLSVQPSFPLSPPVSPHPTLCL